MAGVFPALFDQLLADLVVYLDALAAFDRLRDALDRDLCEALAVLHLHVVPPVGARCGLCLTGSERSGSRVVCRAGSTLCGLSRRDRRTRYPRVRDRSG